MRDNGDFIQDLRREIESTQARRHKYVLAKLAFVTGLLGFVTGLLGVGLAGKDSTATGQLLYLVPLVTFVFDLYILGEDFSVKRAGRFIRESAGSPDEERTWERAVTRTRDWFSYFAGPLAVTRTRDWFSYFAGPLSSALALVAAIFGLRLLKAGTVPVWWIALGVVFVLVVLVHRLIQSVILDRFDHHVSDDRKEADTQA